MRVLLVEDNPAHAELTLEMLRTTLPDPNDAQWVDSVDGLQRTLQSSQSERLQLILLDLSLPGANGHELLGHIRSTHRGKHVPVVILSTSDHPRDIKLAYERGANGYLTKSLDFARFRAAIESAVLFFTRYNLTMTHA